MPDKPAACAKAFLEGLIAAFPAKIEKILTDNGKGFTGRFCATGEREPTGQPIFDVVCKNNNIEHRLIKARHPQANGMAERFNGRISEILRATAFKARAELAEALDNYQQTYNRLLPQKALGYIAPIQSLAKQLNQPNLAGMSINPNSPRGDTFD